jgi:hypothetical protein
MGATSSRGPAASDSIVTVSQRRSSGSADADLVALHRLPAVAPIMQPASFSSLFTASRAKPTEPSLHTRNVNALCREYAALSRQAALPICEEQRALAKKMSSVEALCARVLYLMALRSTELTASAGALRELQELRARTKTMSEHVRQLETQGAALEARAARLQSRRPTP